LVDSGHLHAVIIGNWAKNAGTDLWGTEWAVAVIWTLASKSLLAVYVQGEKSTPTNILLKIGKFLLQKW
jgi:hypothetical protein